MQKIKIIISLTILLIGKMLGQSDYAKYIAADSLRKIHKVKNSHGYQEINYLGTINKPNNDTLYYVFGVYTAVQAAIQIHGHSNIIYLNKKLKEVKSYDVGMQESLPYKLIKNTLYFRYVDEKANKKQIFKNK